MYCYIGSPETADDGAGGPQAKRARAGEPEALISAVGGKGHELSSASTLLPEPRPLEGSQQMQSSEAMDELAAAMGNLLMQAEVENASGSPPDDEMDIQNLPMAVLEQVRDRLKVRVPGSAGGHGKQDLFGQCYSKEKLLAVMVAIGMVLRLPLKGPEEEGAAAMNGLLDALERVEGISRHEAAELVMRAATCEGGLGKGLGDVRKNAWAHLAWA